MLQLPKRAGRSRPGLLVRAIHNTASMNSRLFRSLRLGSAALPRNLPRGFHIVCGGRDRQLDHINANRRDIQAAGRPYPSRSGSSVTIRSHSGKKLRNALTSARFRAAEVFKGVSRTLGVPAAIAASALRAASSKARNRQAAASTVLPTAQCPWFCQISTLRSPSASITYPATTWRPSTRPSSGGRFGSNRIWSSWKMAASAVIGSTSLAKAENVLA